MKGNKKERKRSVGGSMSSGSIYQDGVEVDSKGQHRTNIDQIPSNTKLRFPLPDTRLVTYSHGLSRVYKCPTMSKAIVNSAHTEGPTALAFSKDGLCVPFSLLILYFNQIS